MRCKSPELITLDKRCSLVRMLLAVLLLPAYILPHAVVPATHRTTSLRMQTSDTVLKSTTSTWGGASKDRATAAKTKLTELEKEFSHEQEPAAIKDQLHGFWKLLVADDKDELITQGMTGYGAPSHNTVLGHFQCFEPEDATDDNHPTLQTVEVVSNRVEGRSAVAALKGDFYVGKLQGSGSLGVVEDYTRIEWAGDSRYDSEIEPERWTVGFLSPTLRVCKLEGGLTRVYAKLTSEEAQKEIARLLALPVEKMKKKKAADEDDKDDDRPLWQKRLDAENGGRRGHNYDGPSINSDIP